MTDAEVAQALELVKDTTKWWPCVGGAHDTQVGKMCSTLKLDGADGEENGVGVGFKDKLIERMGRLWGDPDWQHITVDLFRYTPGHGPTLVHGDMVPSEEGGPHGTAKSSVALYLTAPGGKNGAATAWPNVGVRSIPAAGTAVTWLNVNPDGSHNYNALHGVEQWNQGDQDRLVLFMSTEPQTFRYKHVVGFNSGLRELGEQRSGSKARQMAVHF